MSVQGLPVGWIAAAVALTGGAGAGYSASCSTDCDGSGSLDFLDFLCYQDRFAAGDPQADCDGSGELSFFDFLCFQEAFAAGCSSLEVVPLGVEVAPPLLCGVEVVAFAADSRLPFSDVTEVPSPLGGTLLFDIPCNIRWVDCHWALCWGRGYRGAIYYTNGWTRLEIDLPPNSAFYFYMIPNPFADIEFEVAAVRGDERVNVREILSGFTEAEGFGICGGAEVVVIETDGIADFAVGEFSIGNDE